jgi:hypothetical protein
MPTVCTISINVSGARWVPCRRGMTRPQVADGRDGIQIWRTAGNVLNKQSRAYYKGWSSSLGVGLGLNNPSHQNTKT